MRIEPAQPRARPAEETQPIRRARRALLLAAILGVYTAIVLLAALWTHPLQRLHDWTVELGALQPMGIRAALVAGPKNWLRAMLREPSVPELSIDIKLPNEQKLRQKRQQALERGILVQGSDDFVPAVIQQDGRAVRVKLRLKGDFTDHLTSDKWSLRVNVRGDDHILGMRRFSLQHPKVRGYQAEMLFFDALRREGVLVPRYLLAEVAINGRSIGLMAVEEHFSKELLEAQGRRESVIVHFDESLIWDSKDGNLLGFGGAFDSYANATIDVFRASKVKKSRTLSADADIAIGLLRGFVEGELPPSAVFDAETLGRFLAVAEVWGAVHVVRWHNLRFYYDPITARLEPVAYDAAAEHMIAPPESIAAKESFVTAVLADDEIRAAFERAVHRIASEFEREDRIEEIRKHEKPVLMTLHREFPLVEPFPLEKVGARAAALTASKGGAPEQASGEALPLARRYATLLRAYVIADGRKARLELLNAVPETVRVESVRYVSTEDGREVGRAPGFPREMVGTPLGAVPRVLRLPLDSRVGEESLQVEIAAAIVGQAQRFVTTAIRYRPPLKQRPVVSPALEETLRRHPFLRRAEHSGNLFVAEGSWEVDGSIVLPRNVSLVVSEGTRLRFQPDAALIVQGGLQLRGSEEAPIVLEAAGEAGWQGVFVSEAPEGSGWSHAIVRNTRGVGFGKWRLTGGVTFYKSDIRLDSCLFEGTRAEDALNIVRSKFEMASVAIRKTVSDGLDLDFSSGTIQGGSFERIGELGGGDAIDISGSSVSVEGTQIDTVSDKGLSVGEASKMIAKGLVIRDVGTGAACKDGSELVISDSTIERTRTSPLMAYTKKKEYGPAAITATRLQTGGAELVARAQTGNFVSVDGSPVEPESIDVDVLYQTTMRKMPRK